MENFLFVTIGHPESKTAVVKKIPVNIEGKNSAVNYAKMRVGKLLRLFMLNPWLLGFHRELSGFTPKEFYWAIFPSFDAKKPIAASDNWYWRRK